MLWKILGISAVFIALFAVTVAEVAGGRGDFQHYKEYVGAVLGLIGLILLGFGKWRAVKRAKAAAEQPPPEGEAVAVPVKSFFLRSLQYWGPMLILFGAIVSLASPPNLRALAFLKISDLNLKMPASRSVTPEEKTSETNAPTPVVAFPPMKMQGVTAGGTRPSAIINTKVYFVGDRVGEAVVTAIDRQSVTLELGGQTKVLTMR